MSKYYFSDNDEETCYTIAGHKQQMIDNNEVERIVFEAKISDEKGFFYCKVMGEIGEVDGTCGKDCIMYIPRNGKSGICTSYRKLYAQTDKSRTIKL